MNYPYENQTSASNAQTGGQPIDLTKRNLEEQAKAQAFAMQSAGMQKPILARILDMTESLVAVNRNTASGIEDVADRLFGRQPSGLLGGINHGEETACDRPAAHLERLEDMLRDALRLSERIAAQTSRMDKQLG